MPQVPPLPPTYQHGVSVIVLTWNGEALVRECFPNVVAEVSSWPVPHEIILVDNGSADGTVAYVKATFPQVVLVEMGRNTGFSRANNHALRYAQYDTVLFLNNDLVLEAGFIAPLMERLRAPDVGAVAPKMLRWDRTTIDDGLRSGYYASGLFDVRLDTDPVRAAQAHDVTFFCGACVLLKRTVFEAAGGFDELFTPYAWEDLDLSYRLWKRGWRIVYEPRAQCYHKREATTRTLFSKLFFLALVWRNKFFFMWKNLAWQPFLVDHFIWLPWKMLKFLCNGRWRYVVGLLWALPSVPRIMARRVRERRYYKRTDQDVLNHSYRPLSA